MNNTILVRVFWMSLLAANLCSAQWIESYGGNMSDIYSIVSNGTSIFAGTAVSIRRSMDNGANWDTVHSGTMVQSLARVGTSVFAGTPGLGVLRSSNNGSTWEQVNNGLTNYVVNTLHVSGSMLYAGTGSSIFRSTNNGASWVAVDSGWANPGISAMIAFGSRLVASGNGGLHVADESNVVWEEVSTPPMGTIRLFAASGSLLFAATNSGVFVSADTGKTWSSSSSGIPNNDVRGLVVDGTSMYAGTFGSGVYLSTNSGSNWSAVNMGLTYYNINTLSAIGTYLFAGTGGMTNTIWRRPFSEMTAVDGGDNIAHPEGFVLLQNYPNPFNPSTTIRYALPSAVNVKLTIHDLLGREVAMLVDEEQTAGWKEAVWDASAMASGVYFYRLTAGSLTQTSKLVVMK